MNEWMKYFSSTSITPATCGSEASRPGWNNNVIFDNFPFFKRQKDIKATQRQWERRCDHRDTLVWPFSSWLFLEDQLQLQQVWCMWLLRITVSHEDSWEAYPVTRTICRNPTVSQTATQWICLHLFGVITSKYCRTVKQLFSIFGSTFPWGVIGYFFCDVFGVNVSELQKCNQVGVLCLSLGPI